MKRIAQMLLGLMLVFQGVAWAGSDSQESTGAKVGYGVGSVVGSAVYLPFKASFCILGGNRQRLCPPLCRAEHSRQDGQHHLSGDLGHYTGRCEGK